MTQIDMQQFLNGFTKLYPVWLVGTALLAFFWPPSMLWFSGQWIVWALSLSMLGMGLTLSPKDFQGILKMPGSVTLGFVCQYTVMPLIGWGVNRTSLRKNPVQAETIRNIRDAWPITRDRVRFAIC